MEKELAFLLTNKTWILKPLPEGRKVVKCKWIYKVNYKPSGEVERFKARLVAKGFSQVAGVDYTESHAPIIKYDVVAPRKKIFMRICLSCYCKVGASP